EQAAPWNPVYLLGRKAEELRRGADGLDVVLDGGEVVHAGAVLVTAGIGEFTPRPLPAGDGWLGRGMVHFVPSLDAHAGQDAVVAALGFTADLGPIENWGLDIHQRAIQVDSTMATGVERVFAAGDVAAYRGKVKLIATGFGEAATAINNIAVTLNPEAHLFPG